MRLAGLIVACSVLGLAGCGSNGTDGAATAVTSTSTAATITASTAPATDAPIVPTATVDSGPPLAAEASEAPPVPACVSGMLETGDGAANGRAAEVSVLQRALGIPDDGEYQGTTQDAVAGWAIDTFGPGTATAVADLAPSSNARGDIVPLGLAHLGILCAGSPLGCPEEIFQSQFPGPWVSLLQKSLINAGFGQTIESSGGADGRFGDGTRSAVQAWAAATGLELQGEEGQPWIRPVEWKALGYTC